MKDPGIEPIQEKGEIPEDIRRYLAEHPGITLNPISFVVQRVLRLRMQREAARAKGKETPAEGEP